MSESKKQFNSEKHYYEVYVGENNCDSTNGYSVCIESSVELNEDEVIDQAVAEGQVNGDDVDLIEYVQEMNENDWLDFHGITE